MDDLIEPILSEGNEASFAAEFTELDDVGAACDEVSEGVIEDEHLIDAEASGVAGFAALIAATAFERFIGLKALEGEELSHFV